MSRPVTISAVVAVLVGILGGFLWWGLPSTRMQAELRDSQTAAERLGRQLEEARTQHQRLEEQLRSQQGQREAAERDLRREREQNAKLQVLIGQGRK